MGSPTMSTQKPQSNGKMSNIDQASNAFPQQNPNPGMGQGSITYPNQSGQPMMGMPNAYSNTVGQPNTTMTPNTSAMPAGKSGKFGS